MAKTGSITIAQGTQEIANNRTYITVTGKITTTGESYRGNSRTGTYTIKQGNTVIKSGNFTHGAPANSTTTLFTVSLWVYHDSSGNSGTITASYNYDSGWCTGSVSTTLTKIARVSQPSCITWPDTTYDVGDIGRTISIHMNKKASFTHTVKYKWGALSAVIATGVTDNVQWTIPTEFMNEIPDGLYGTGTIIVDTYNGSALIGSNSVAFRANVPESIKPTATVTLVDAEGHLEKYGKYVQGQSKLHVSIAVEGVYGSTIKTYKTTFDGKTFTDAEFTTDAIVGKDTLELEVVVTDSRGRSCDVKESIEIYEYNRPKITSIKAKRCQQHNVNLIGDEYLGVLFSATVTSLDNQNTVTYELDYKKTTEGAYTTIPLDDYTDQYSVTDGNTTFAADDDAYNIILRISDDFGAIEKKISGPSVSVLISKLKYNLGIAFGKLAELSGVFDIGFKTRFFGGILQMVLEEGSDFNEQMTPNLFTLKDISAAGYFHCPVAEGKGSLKIEECGEGCIHQIFKLFDKVHPLVYERTYSDETWSDWILTNGDYIVEQGTSGIWTYEKWASGKVELYGYDTSSVAIDTAVGYGYRCAQQVVSLPFTVYKPKVWADCCDLNAWAGTMTYPTMASTDGVSYILYRHSSYTSYTYQTNLLVKGRWKE